MRRDSSPPGDGYRIRCVRLAHEIPFSYCRSENNGLPCFRILDCWYSHFLVEDYLRSELEPEEWDEILNNPGKPKAVSLLELIDQARERGK